VCKTAHSAARTAIWLGVAIRKNMLRSGSNGLYFVAKLKETGVFQKSEWSYRQARNRAPFLRVQRGSRIVKFYLGSTFFVPCDKIRDCWRPPLSHCGSACRFSAASTVLIRLLASLNPVLSACSCIKIGKWLSIFTVLDFFLGKLGLAGIMPNKLFERVGK